ncbi:MAG: tol-pal system YbgF family protein [Chthoniobacteraceae bacterium]
MKIRLPSAIAVLCLSFGSCVLFAADPVNIVLKDGQTVSASELHRDGKTVIATVVLPASAQNAPAAPAKIGYPASSIASIAFPAPPGIAAAAKSLNEGNAAEALARIEPVAAYQDTFRDIAGNWWARAAVVKIKTLLALNRDAEAEALMEKLIQAKEDPENILQARLQLASVWGRKGKNSEALNAIEAVIQQSTDEGTRAEAWLRKGEILLNRKQYEPALLACLHLPVYFSNQRAFAPAALLGSARAYAGLKDTASARDALDAVILRYPASPEAALAKVELEKLNSL